MKKKKYAVGVDIGGTHISSAVVDLSTGELCAEPHSTDIDQDRSAEEIFSAWTKNLRLTLAESPTPVSLIGMAFPGPFDYEKGVSHMEHKFADINGLNVGEILSARMLEHRGLEFRYVNDAGAFALGESFFGAAKDMKRVLVLTLGTGLGSGFIDNHKIVRTGGKVPEGGEVWDLPYGGGIADEAFSTRWIVKRYKELSGRDVKGARDVALRHGFDDEAKVLFNEFGWRLADFTIPLLKDFECTNLLLGGNISRSLNLFINSMKHRYGQSDMDVDVKASTLLDKAAMLGAASLFV